ncbi:unnamed protein product [Microthlaspi erraticum]|uniref:Pentacotripeptide-repeat region of PRORP domain-containing protein n=1 Tax=Microthlaspi erraticum TaxID=1685480 RepID=A0A6D2HHV4_9BRAS|nr:unnamed protein product [Microthlaspi erraticum]CAA7042476.1 unnamed protein product [Microthlaspi erraticum]
MMRPSLQPCRKVHPIFQEGNQLNPSDLRSIVDTLRDSERSLQALKVSEWMSEQKVFDLIPEDFAARLNLTGNALGLEEAEKFFESIAENKQGSSVYATILSFYARSEKNLDKAEFIFLKTKELGFLCKPASFNHMMSLYIQLDKLQ